MRSKGGQRGFTIKYARHENVPAGQRPAPKRGVAVDLYTHTWRPSLLWERPVLR